MDEVRSRGLNGLAELFNQARFEEQFYVICYMNDRKSTVQQLVRKPGFSLAVLGLAVGIGLVLAILAVVDGVLVRDLPFLTPDQLVRVFNSCPKAGVKRDGSAGAKDDEGRRNIPVSTNLSTVRDGPPLAADRQK